MIIGIDYYRTITANPKVFRSIVQPWIDVGYSIHVITAVRKNNIAATRNSITKGKVPHTNIEIVQFENYEDIPTLKLTVCKQLGVKLMFDDMPETCELLSKHGIMTAQIR